MSEPNATEPTATEPTATVPRRVVTGHDEQGKSVFVSDGIVPVHKYMPQDGVGFYEIWQTEDAPAPIAAVEPSEPTQRTLRVPPEPRGTKIRVNEFFPGHVGPEGRQSPMHRTETVDYGIVLEGEIVLILDDTEKTLTPGDVVIQRGTDHAWANRTDRVARVAFILVGGEFTEGLLDTLPEGAHEHLMTDGPHDEASGTAAGAQTR